MTAAEIKGRRVSFDHPDLKVRVAGVVLDAKANGVTARGSIPDLLVKVQGGSGKTCEVSFVETYMKISDL